MYGEREQSITLLGIKPSSDEFQVTLNDTVIMNLAEGKVQRYHANMQLDNSFSLIITDLESNSSGLYKFITDYTTLSYQLHVLGEWLKIFYLVSLLSPYAVHVQSRQLWD